MNIHIVSDEKFINQSFVYFEQYYARQNIFFVQVPRKFSGGFKYVKPRERVIPLCLTNTSAVSKILSYCEGEINLFIHLLSPMKAYIALQLLSQVKLKTYWIFYGADLYGLLEKNGWYELNDYNIEKKLNLVGVVPVLKKILLSMKLRTNLNKITEEFFAHLDYFCFWNHFDYKLFEQYFDTKAKFKFFRYYHSSKSDFEIATLEKDAHTILVNHSASKFGNHLTILESLKNYDHQRNIKRLYVPLSYGSEQVQKIVLNYGYKNLNYCFQPILNFLPQKEYADILKNVGVAFFGQRRQEAGNNIFSLLANGAKVFLRRDNNMIEYFREMGYHIFEFESDFKSIDDLKPMPRHQQKENREYVLKEFSKEEIDKTYQNLID